MKLWVKRLLRIGNCCFCGKLIWPSDPLCYDLCKPCHREAMKGVGENAARVFKPDEIEQERLPLDKGGE